jgi:predicted Zn-ribbon and HTH transcriptional regulator
MEYENWKLKWDYEYYEKSKKYEVRNIRPVCRDCGCELTELKGGNYSGFCCPICKDKWYEVFDKHDALRKIIEHKIKNKLF